MMTLEVLALIAPVLMVVLGVAMLTTWLDDRAERRKAQRETAG
jgi:hypothetical protein